MVLITIWTVLVAAICLALLLILRCLWILREIQQVRSQKGGLRTRRRTQPCKTLVVLGSGGHTSEMLHMVRQLDPKRYQPMEFVVADTDHTSVQRLQALIPGNQHTVHTIPRSREVGQSYVSSLFSTLYALVHAIVITIQIRPELLLCNGPGTCVPVVMGAWMLRILGFPCRFVFVESFCRAQTLSLTGKILYKVVHCFLVHWESLHQKYPNTYLARTFVKRSHPPPQQPEQQSMKRE